MNNKSKLLSIGLGFLASYEFMQEERKEEILQKWEESKKLPRKLKKKVRKQLNQDWQIANIDIFSCL